MNEVFFFFSFLDSLNHRSSREGRRAPQSLSLSLFLSSLFCPAVMAGERDYVQELFEAAMRPSNERGGARPPPRTNHAPAAAAADAADENDDDATDNARRNLFDFDSRCSICLCSPSTPSLRCSLLPCGHSAFCVPCVRRWLVREAGGPAPSARGRCGASSRAAGEAPWSSCRASRRRSCCGGAGRRRCRRPTTAS